MSKLDAALAWAERGFPVFPLAANSKLPVHKGWQDVATSDPNLITLMWQDPVLGTPLDYNIGTLCTDRVVVDIDVKGGKDGLNQYATLGGHYETLVVRTPTGGYHCYFDGADSSNSPIAADVDIRSHNGFVVAPGSTIDGVEYTIVTDRAPAWVPGNVEKLLRAPEERRANDNAAAIDSEASIQAAINYLQSAPPAIEGSYGDGVTFVTAAHIVRELALSVDLAFNLIAEHWNPRCSPPWDVEELYLKVQNAAEYGTAEYGRLDPSITFAGIGELPPPPSVFIQSGTRWGNAIDPEDIPPRPWLIPRMLMLQELTLLLAPGSAGKSSISLALAAHLAVGQDFAGYVLDKPCKSIIFNGEDDVREQSRRLYAVCASYDLDYNVVKRSVMLLSAEDIDLRLISAPTRVPVINEALVSHLVAQAEAPDVGLVVYDPLVDVHDVDEGDNMQMNAVMRLMKRISREANVASLVLHHTTKGTGVKQEDRVGNMDIARGASGIVYKARIAFTLLNASQEDCETFGFQDSERHTWVRLDDAKMNLALANQDATWFHKEGVMTPQGDAVGVLKFAEPGKNRTELVFRLADILIKVMTANGEGSMTIGQAVAVLKQQEPLYANKTDAQVKQAIEGLFATVVEYQGKRLQTKRDGDSAKSPLRVVLT